MQTVIDWEPLEALLASGMAECTVAQWHESGRDHEDVPLSVDWAKYQAAESAGLFRLLSARRDGVLVGYLAAFIGPHLMYSTTMHALCDSIYVKPEHRGVGWALLFAMERKLQELFPNQTFRVIYCSQVGDVWGRVLERAGYSAREVVHVKVLK